jgi:hypothetical protein
MSDKMPKLLHRFDQQTRKADNQRDIEWSQQPTAGEEKFFERAFDHLGVLIKF